MDKQEKIKLWLPVLLWAGVIFGFSSLEINKVPTFNWIDFIVKKTAHVTEYAVFYWLLWRAWSNKGQVVGKKQFVWTLVIGMIYALSDEWHQTFVAGREGTLRDVGFDTIGMLLAWSQIKRNV